MEAYVDNRAQFLCEKDRHYEEPDLMGMCEGQIGLDHQPVMVACPSRVRKAILRNLHAAAHSRVDPTRAAVARRWLRAQNGTPAIDSTLQGASTAREQAVAVVVQPVAPAPGSPALAPARAGGVVARVARQLKATLGKHVTRPLSWMWRGGWRPQRPRTSALG